MSLRNRWRTTRIRRYRKRIESLIDDGQWAPALTAVIDFAQWAEGNIDDAEVWLDMTISATRIVGHLQDPAEYRAFLSHFADPFLGDEERPRPELLKAFAAISGHVDPAVMRSIGRWLSDARPRWPLGPYLIAHFLEIDDRSDVDANIDAAPTQFKIAARRADAIDEEHWRLHAELRRGALLLTSGHARHQGRDILGQLNWSELRPEEQLWMAVALANSPQWTDRLRSIDIVLDLHDAVSRARPSHRHLKLRDLRRAASTLFKLAGLDLPEAESRRIAQLSKTLFDGPDRETWSGFLEARQRLSELASLPFGESSKAQPLLDELSAIYPDRWQPATRRFQILEAGYRGNYRAGDNPLSANGRDHRLPIADSVAGLLDMLAIDDAPGVEVDSDEVATAIDELNEVLDGLSVDGDGAAARPVALVWPRLLDAADLLDADTLGSRLKLLARYHTAVAPPPTYGWWNLAAHLYDAAFDDAADVVATTALSTDRQSADDTVRGEVAIRAFERATENRDTANARRWLDELPA